MTRRLAHEPFGRRPTALEVSVHRYLCTGCRHLWRQDTRLPPEPRAKLSRRRRRWALEAIEVQHPSDARVAAGLRVARDTANDAVLDEGKRMLINDEHRFDGVAVVGVDEHVWRHIRRGDTYSTVIVDLTGIRDGTGPARLRDVVESSTKQVLRPGPMDEKSRRDAMEVVGMEGFTELKTATAEKLPDAMAMLDPFHVVHSADDTLDWC